MFFPVKGQMLALRPQPGQFLGASRSAPGLWLAGGLFRDGILPGPLVGYLLATGIQGQQASPDLDLTAFDPDRFGDWFRTRAY